MQDNIKITVGTQAPDFSLPDKDGKPVTLKSFLGKSAIILFFYPKDETYGCTKEACSFRDMYEDFKDAGAEVIGISSDDNASHREFASHHRLPFVLLSDMDRSVAKQYGVGNTLGFIRGRVTFVIDRQGIIRMIYSSQINYEKHVREALEVMKRL
jgi:thioredoxin-dependent peroxiredoxin